MSDETIRREILQMLAKGAIDSKQASEMLQQLSNQTNSSKATETPPMSEEAPAQKTTRQQARWLNIKVEDLATRQERVKVRIPLGLARMGVRIGAHFAPEINDLDWDELLEHLGSTDISTLVEVSDREDGDYVHVYVD